MKPEKKELAQSGNQTKDGVEKTLAVIRCKEKYALAKAREKRRRDHRFRWKNVKEGRVNMDQA